MAPDLHSTWSVALCTLAITVSGILLTAIYRLINRIFTLALERYRKRVAVSRTKFALDLVKRKHLHLTQSRGLALDDESLMWAESLNSARKEIDSN